MAGDEERGTVALHVVAHGDDETAVGEEGGEPVVGMAGDGQEDDRLAGEVGGGEVGAGLIDARILDWAGAIDVPVWSRNPNASISRGFGPQKQG